MKVRPRLLIADDHAILAAGIKRLLEQEFDVVGTLSTGTALVDAAARLLPDVIVTDVSMPVMDGIEATRRIHREWPSIKIVLLSMHDDPLLIPKAREAGAAAYVFKRDGPDVLIRAILRVLSGGEFISSGFGLQARSAPTSQRSEAPLRLTPRQRQVLELVVQGHSLREIASRLHISPKTVEFHKTALKEQLGVKSSAEMVAVAVRQGIGGR